MSGLNKIFFRSLKQTRSRFISIFCIVFIGSAFFAGLKNAPPTMRESMGQYYENHNFADLTLISTLGFSADDLDYIDSLDETAVVSGSFRSDFIFSFSEEEKIYHVIAHSKNEYFNQYDVIEGRDIESSDEVLLDERFGTSDMIGKTMVIENSYGTTELTVVGIVNSSLYIIDYERGTNSYSNQSNNGFIIMHPDYLQDYIFPDTMYDLTGEDFLYNEVLVSYNLEDIPNIFTDEYDDYTKSTRVAIEDAVSTLLHDNRTKMIDELKAELEEPTQQYEEGLAEYEESVETYTYELNEAKIQLIEAKLTVLDKQVELNESIASISGYTDEMVTEIADLQSQITTLQEQLNSFSLPTITQEEINEALSGLSEEEIPTVEEIQEALGETEITEETWNEILASLSEMDASSTSEDVLALIENYQQEVNNSVSSFMTSINEQLDYIYSMLDDVVTMSDSLSLLIDGYTQIEAANLEVEKQQAILDNTEIEMNQQLEEASAQLEEAKAQLDEAQATIDSIPSVTLYALTHNENVGAVSFKSDTQSINSLSYIFPVVFYLVAALVSMTTMTRMVDEQRVQNGTLKALGYSNKDIMMYYVKYVLLATVGATILGIIFGTYGLSGIIYYLYNTLMYDVVGADTIFVFKTSNTIWTFVVSVGMTLAITLAVAYRNLGTNAATLMRPKSPKIGKRVFLEKIDFIWKRFTFNQKVTIRNMFRYKMRFAMSIIGITGCTALLVTGFGLKSSISGILTKQFQNLFTYDASVSLQDDLTSDETDELVEYVESVSNVSGSLRSYNFSGIINSSSVSNDDSINVIVLSQRDTALLTYNDIDLDEQVYGDDDGILISQKISVEVE